MSDHRQVAAHLVRTIAIAALVVWGLYAWWALGRVRQTGQALRQTIETGWPLDGRPRLAAREQVAATADELAAGRPWSFGTALTPAAAPSVEERAAAARFLAGRSGLRTRLLDLTAAARDLASDGADVQPVREALARAYGEAIDGQENPMTRQLDRAEQLLALAEPVGAGAEGPADRQTVARLAAAVEPAWRLSQDLVTEGAAAAEKVLVLAARSAAQERYADSAAALRLAGQLLGARMALPDTADGPHWLAALGDQAIPAADRRQAAAALELAQAMVASLAPGPSVEHLLRSARRHFDAGRYPESAWWAAITLNALGMSDRAIAAAIGAQATPTDRPGTQEEANP